MIKQWNQSLPTKVKKDQYIDVQKTIERVLTDQDIELATLSIQSDHISIITNDQGFYYDDRYEEQSDNNPSWSLTIKNNNQQWKLIADSFIFENLDQHQTLLNKLNFLNQAGLLKFSYDYKLNRLGFNIIFDSDYNEDRLDLIVNLDHPLSKISNQKLTNLVQYLKLIQSSKINLNYGLPQFDEENPKWSGNYQIVLNENGSDGVVIEMLDKNDQLDGVFKANLLDCLDDLESQWDQYCKWDWNDLEFKDLSFGSFENLPFEVGNGMFVRELLENNWIKHLEDLARSYNARFSYYCNLNKYGEQIRYHVIDSNDYKSFNTYNENQIIKVNQKFDNWLKLSTNLQQSSFNNENNCLEIFFNEKVKIIYQFENNELEKLSEMELKDLNHYLISLKNALAYNNEFNYQYFNDETNSNFQSSWELFFNNKNLVDLKDFKEVKIVVKSHSTEMQLNGARYLQKGKTAVADLINVIHPDDLELKALIKNYHKGRNVKKPVFKIV